MNEALALAKQVGFECFAAIKPDEVITSEELAASCSPRTCNKYASCWTCPPGAGALEERRAHFQGKDAGVLVLFRTKPAIPPSPQV